MDIDTRGRNENEPLLVVFSDEKKAKKATPETTEMLHHEQDLRSRMVTAVEQEGNDEEDDDGDEGEEVEDEEEEGQEDERDDETASYDDARTNLLRRTVLNSKTIDNFKIRKRDIQESRKRRNVTNSEQSHSIGRARQKPRVIHQGTNHTNTQTNSSPNERTLKKMYINERESIRDARRVVKRTKRGKARKKKRRNVCRRKPMNVNFVDINWHTWIIAPAGYQVKYLDLDIYWENI